ncbi:MAG: DUF1837 domain-containing protein [Anaerolineae bacterium]|nr:DUF1837 domain-containing protein [Anaerolineae bacterium]
MKLNFDILLGNLVKRTTSNTGVVIEKYIVRQAHLDLYRNQLIDCIKNYHTAYNYIDELTNLGFFKTAQALYNLTTHIPVLQSLKNSEENFIKGDFGEIIGNEYARQKLNYTTYPFAKLLNPNPDIPAHGLDVIGINIQPVPRLLVGEAKFYKQVTNDLVKKVCEGLAQPTQANASLGKKLGHIRLQMKLQGDNHELQIFDQCSTNLTQRLLFFCCCSTSDCPPSLLNWLEAQTHNLGMKNLTCVYIYFDLAQDPDEWIRNLYEEVRNEQQPLL